MAEIHLERVVKHFRDVRAVDDVELTIGHGEFMVLLGPSGCGKTTLLRSIAGLERIDAGRVWIGGRDVTELPPRKRRIAMVFQSYAVFPHLSVFENIAFGLRMARIGGSEVRRRVETAAELLQIGELLARYPSQVSGGQRQRVAVARAIVMEPEVLLMDEPLSNLDALLRLEMRAELKRLLSEVGSTTVYVTHDQVEALSMGDRIAIMRSGKILQVGDPLSIYDHPVDRFVGGFIGNPPMNFLDTRLEERPGGGLQAVLPGAGAIEVDGHASDALKDRVGGQVVLGIRAENIEVIDRAAADREADDRVSTTPAGHVRGQCRVVEPLGSHNLLTVRVGREQVKVSTHAESRVKADDIVLLRIDPRRARWLDPDSGRAIEP